MKMNLVKFINFCLMASCLFLCLKECQSQVSRGEFKNKILSAKVFVFVFSSHLRRRGESEHQTRPLRTCSVI